METLILALLGMLYIALSSSNSDTKDKNYNTIDKIKVDRANKEKTLYRKFDNMNEYEIDKWLKEKDLYHTYGSYGRQTKINKIVERYKYLNQL